MRLIVIQDDEHSWPTEVSAHALQLASLIPCHHHVYMYSYPFPLLESNKMWGENVMATRTHVLSAFFPVIISIRIFRQKNYVNKGKQRNKQSAQPKKRRHPHNVHETTIHQYFERRSLTHAAEPIAERHCGCVYIYIYRC